MVSLPQPTGQRRVFVDSSAYLALRDLDDEHHAAAVTILTQLATLRYRQFTTNVILYEAHALILSTLGIAHGQSFLRDMEESNTALIRVRAQDENRAKQIVYQYTDKDFSLADATSFTVMERLAIRSAFTFDRHFAQYGMTMLTPDLSW